MLFFKVVDIFWLFYLWHFWHFTILAYCYFWHLQIFAIFAFVSFLQFWCSRHFGMIVVFDILALSHFGSLAFLHFVISAFCYLDMSEFSYLVIWEGWHFAAWAFWYSIIVTIIDFDTLYRVTFSHARHFDHICFEWNILDICHLGHFDNMGLFTFWNRQCIY